MQAALAPLALHPQVCIILLIPALLEAPLDVDLFFFWFALWTEGFATLDDALACQT